MENFEEQSSEEILWNELVKAEEIGESIATQSRENLQEGQRIADIAKAAREVVDNGPQLIDIEAQIGFWRDINSHSKRSLRGLEEANESLSLASGTVSTASTSIITSFASTEDMIPLLIPDKQKSTRIAVNNFINVVSYQVTKEDVIKLLKLHGFDKSIVGKKSPLDLYVTGYHAFERPVSDEDPISTSLIPIRECIASIIAELLRRRPEQEKAKSNYDKVISIGMQLRRDGINDYLVGEWASQWEKLVNDLSKAKQGELTRKEWGFMIQRATLFLNGMLKGLKPTEK